MSINGVVTRPGVCDLPGEAPCQQATTPLRERLERAASRASLRLPPHARKSERPKKLDLDSPAGINVAERWVEPDRYRLLGEGLLHGGTRAERASAQRIGERTEASTEVRSSKASPAPDTEPVLSWGETSGGDEAAMSKFAPTSIVMAMERAAVEKVVDGEGTLVIADAMVSKDSTAAEGEPALPTRPEPGKGSNAAPQAIEGLLGNSAIGLAFAAMPESSTVTPARVDGATHQASPLEATERMPGQDTQVTFAFGSWLGDGHTVVAQWMATSSGWLLHAQSERVRQALLERVDSTALEGVKVDAIVDDTPGKRRRRESDGEPS